MSTSRPNYFGKGSVVVPSDGEGAVRRLAITADRLVTRPFEGINVIPDILSFAARSYGGRDAVGWRNIVTIHEEEEAIEKSVRGVGVIETRKLKYLELSDFQYISFLELQERALELARGVNWQLMSHACAMISTPVVTAYDTLGEAGLKHSLNEPDCVGIFTNAELIPTLARVIKDTPSIRLVVYDGDPKSSSLDRMRGVREDIALVSIDELQAIGRTQPLDILEPRRPSPEDVALIMYTNGSTGAPKGVVLTHGNVVASVGGVYHLLGHHLRPDDSFLAFLPLAHILEYVVEISSLLVGAKMGYGRVKTLTDASVRNCKGDLVAFRPTILVGVPHVWETLRKDILAKMNTNESLKSVFNGTMAIKKANIPLLTDVADVVMLSGVRANTGGRLRLAISGGAALSTATQEFLSTALATLLQGYGMTESCAMCSLFPPELFQYGVVGLPLPCIEIKLIDVPKLGYQVNGRLPQGEVCIRGPAVSKGYYKRPDLNEDDTIFIKDGWLRTGDVGKWNPNGTLTLIDRIDNFVKLHDGTYIALERLEAVYKSCNVVANICLHASAEDKQPIAVIVPHRPNLRHALTRQVLPDIDLAEPLLNLCYSQAVRELVLKECNLVGKKNNFKPVEMLEGVVLTAEEWTPENGLVTGVCKVDRDKIAKFFKQEIRWAHQQL